MATNSRMLFETTWDLGLDGVNRIARVTDSERVRQKMRERLQAFEGEWFLDSTVGLPWFQEIFTRPFDKGNTDSLLKESIVTTTGVNKLLTYSSDIDFAKRIFRVLNYTVDSTYGPVEVTS